MGSQVHCAKECRAGLCTSNPFDLWGGNSWTNRWTGVVVDPTFETLMASMNGKGWQAPLPGFISQRDNMNWPLVLLTIY